MNGFDKHEYEQRDNPPNQSTVNMPNSYSTTRLPPLIIKQGLNHQGSNGIYKDANEVQSIQQWKLQTSNQQQSPYNNFSQPSVDKLSSAQYSNISTISNLPNEIIASHIDKSSNKIELSTIVDEPEKSITTMKKRVTPIPASYARRRPHLKNELISNESTNNKLLTPQHKNKVREPGTTTTKRSGKTTPIFIPPKKTSPQPHSFSTLSFDDSLQIKRKTILERQHRITDDPNSLSNTPWPPAPSISPTRSFPQSSGSSHDEDSSDESDHESLLIRKKHFQKKDPQLYLSFPIYGNIPSAILITDPYGRSHAFDPDKDTLAQSDLNEQFFEDDSNPTDKNTLFPNSTFDISTSPDLNIVPPTSPIILDKHTLHSIGEEEEDVRDDDNNVLSKDLNHTEALTRSHQTNIKEEDSLIQDETDKGRAGRRWSDGFIDQENEQNSLAKSLLTKMSSTSSIPKQPANPSVKVSKTKYLLMKLHLTSSSKDDESIISSTPINSSYKHLQKQLSPKDASTTNLNTSSNTLTSQEQTQRQDSEINKDESTEQSNYFNDKTKQKFDQYGSVGNINEPGVDSDSDDDIDGKFENAKKGLAKRAASSMDVRGSRLSLASIASEAKAFYDLEITGTIELKLTYAVTTGALDILINKCTNLAKAKRNTTSDPYVKIYLLPDRSKNSKRKTTTKKNTTDPVYEEKFRYHVVKQEFETRVIWISVWNQTSIGSNDFLGEIHIPLANCTLDKTEEHELLGKSKKEDIQPTAKPTMGTGEIQFQLSFMENPKNKDVGILQVHYIEGKSIFYGKHEVDATCSGLLMPDNIKRKLATVRKGPAPKWEIPLRWEGVRRDNLKNTSIEITISCQERLRKVTLGFVRLNLAQGHFDNKPVQWLDATNVEKEAWETFLKKPTQTHQIRLPLRPPTHEHK